MNKGWSLEFQNGAIVFQVDRLRREKDDLHGELSVICNLPKARTTNGFLSIADFNFSSESALTSRAKILKDRAGTNGTVDWLRHLDEFRQGVHESERQGDPAVDLRTLLRPKPDDELVIEGLAFPLRHPSCLFGDGGAAKSYTALYVAGTLAKRGLKIALFDWELCGEDHRDRLERIFGQDMPRIMYVRCDRPLIVEADRLSRIAAQEKLDFNIFDSVAFACDGPPESAETAGRYFRAVREIGGGSLHLAHINRSETSDAKPFGSAFWHNGFRSTWFVDAREGTPGILQLGFHNRKCNLGALRPSTSLIVRFQTDTTEFLRADIAAIPELAERLPVHKQMSHLLRRGSLQMEAIAEELSVDLTAVKKAFQRGGTKFIRCPDGSIGLRVTL